jgi:hypothetical protein
MSNIGILEFVFGNTTCRIIKYYPYDKATQCHRCQQYRHPTQLCKEETQVACVVYARPHPTKEHPYKFPNCHAGPTCKHLPIKCTARNGLHKASDQNCPARVVAFQHVKDTQKGIGNGKYPSQPRPQLVMFTSLFDSSLSLSLSFNN